MPVKPACDPLQFIKVKPCILSVTAQKQIKRAEEVKKIKEVIKEEPEDWQNVSNFKFYLLPENTIFFYFL